jgi:hypothetical protein
LGLTVALTARQAERAATSPATGGGTSRGPALPAGPAPRLPNGTIDLSGVWQGGGPVGNIADGLAKGETLPIRPEWKKIMDGRKAGDDPEANCLPTGVPRRDPYPWRILQTPTHTFMLFEGNIHSYRQIFMDGRKHPEDLDPTWYGHSVGKWKATRSSLIPSASTTSSGSTSSARRIPSSCTRSSATRGPTGGRW